MYFSFKLLMAYYTASSSINTNNGYQAYQIDNGSVSKQWKYKQKVQPKSKPMAYETYKPATFNVKSTSSRPINNKNSIDKTVEYDMKELLVTGYIRHVIFILLGNDDEEDDDDQEAQESIMNIIPLDVIKLCEQYYEANMIIFMIQSCFDQSLLNGVECINLNCKKIIKFKTVSMEDTSKVVTLDQHWFDKTVYTYYLPNITIPKQAYSSYPEILEPIQQPSIILKCNLNSWRTQHQASMIIFDNRLLHNWNFTNIQNDNTSLLELDANTKEIDAFEMPLPALGGENNNYYSTQLRLFAYSKDHGLLAGSISQNDSRFSIYRLKFGEMTEKDDEKKSDDDGWKWVNLKSFPQDGSVCGMAVVESPSLEYGKYEKLFLIRKLSEATHRDSNMKSVKSMEYEIGYYDPINKTYRELSKFRANGQPKHQGYWSSYNTYTKPPYTTHKGHCWKQPSLHYNPTHKKVFIGGDDTQNIEGYDVIKDCWMFLPKTQYTHLKGCTLWSLSDQSNDILYIDQGKKVKKNDNLIEFFDLRDHDQTWKLSPHYMQWKEIASNKTENWYHVYRRSFI